MPRDPDQALTAAERKLAKREQSLPSAILHRAPGWLEKAAERPLFEVLLARDWDEELGLAGSLVARYSPQGQIAAASFLVDLACLGVKSSEVHLFKSPRDYERQMRERILKAQPMVSGDLNLVAKIIATGVDYAQSLGFSPDPVYYQARLLLGDADPAACTVDVPVGGPEGKPCFVAGPYDDVHQVMNKLTRAVGAGGFHFVAPLGPDSDLLLDDDLEVLLEDDEEV